MMDDEAFEILNERLKLLDDRLKLADERVAGMEKHLTELIKLNTEYLAGLIGKATHAAMQTDAAKLMGPVLRNIR